MKTIIHYIVILVAGASVFACDDFLDKTPIDQIAAEEYFTDEASAESAVRAIYRSLESSTYYGQSMIIIPEFAAGHVQNVYNYPEFVNFEQNDIRIDNPWVLNIWTASYSSINAANNVIASVPQMTGAISEEKKSQFVREAKFIRALVYFNLVRSWGDVPLITTPTASSTSLSDLQVSRTAASQVYAQIIADLNDAVSLPASYSSLDQTKGRATQYAAKALLSKVYLYQGDYPQAATFAKEVISKGDTLTSDYASIWLTENSQEAIFELQFDAQATNPLATVSNPTGSALFFAKDTVYKFFEDGDTRRDFTLNFQNGRYYIGKYRNYNPATQNVPVIRLSEIYLIYAEAQARVSNSPAGEPYQYYKAIRDRAGLETPDEGTFDLQGFITVVQREKRLELMFEGEAWYDYARTGLALTEMMTVPDEGRYLFPIPQTERELNLNLGQNTAYQ
ncbi:RagB/SusD family nutrient uptake outer membrane protein [Ohtaekwangia koreensis]|uniref:SusD family protein n=1 Tax=Ohtaekwangia koreensis TaxID=688867 RepID=A0A1T5J9Z0_9BACT|nr:RagB/SusD family nutrient uptake outer membrane protein [Ohtaekwangia koreensis]SKC48063.1 SusD family protein [Ohtaekwangia koreensis]